MESSLQKFSIVKNITSEMFSFFQELVRHVFSALRAIAGNDDVKDAVVNAGGVPLIVIAMNRHMGNQYVSTTLSSGNVW